MPGPRIRWDYDQLDQIAQQFSEQADNTRATINILKRQLDVLQGGDWIGAGATAFYTEMNGAVLPALQRLASALEAAAHVMAQIKALGKLTEDEAAQILRRLANMRTLNLGAAGAEGEAAAGAAVGATANVSGGGFLSGVGDFFEGAWEEGKNMVTGLAHAIIHPIDTAKGLYYGVTHPGEMWDALKKPFVDDWNSGHPWRAIGRGALMAGTFLIGAGEVGEGAKAAEVADVARVAEVADAAKVAEVAKVGEAADVAKVAETARVVEAAKAGDVVELTKVGESADAAGASSAQARLMETLRLRGRQLELGTDPARKYIEAEGIGGVRIEQALGRQIARSVDTDADFVDKVIGPISLKGPIPAAGDVQGLADKAIWDSKFNTYTKAVFVDTKGLSPTQISNLKSVVEAGAQGARKPIFILE